MDQYNIEKENMLMKFCFKSYKFYCLKKHTTMKFIFKSSDIYTGVYIKAGMWLIKVTLIQQCCQNICYLKYYTLFWQSVRIILYLYFFQSNTLKILYFRIKFLKESKVLYIYFFLKYLIHISSLSSNEHIQKNFARAFGARISYTYIFQAMLF